MARDFAFSTSFFEDIEEQRRRDELKRCISFLVEGCSEAEPYPVRDLPVVSGIFADEQGVIWFIVRTNTKPIEFDDVETESLEALLGYLERDMPWWDKE